MRATPTKIVFTVLLSLLVLLLGACTTPPNVTPFADATVALRSAVRAAGDAAVDGVRASGLETAAADAQKLQGAMKPRVATMDALVDYARGLREITAAAEKSNETVSKIADSVAAVAGAAGIVMPPIAAVGVMEDAARFVFKQISNARATASLEVSLEAADAALQKIAWILEQDVGSLDIALVGAGNTAQEKIRDREPKLESLTKRLNESEAEIKAVPISGIDAAGLTKLGVLTPLRDSLATQVAARSAEVAAVRARTNLNRSLVHAMSDAIMAWGSAHAQLVEALRTHQSVSIDSLVDATVELRSIVYEVRQLKGK